MSIPFGEDPEDRVVNIRNRVYKLELTCFMCPEQWDVFDDCLDKLGYIRLRHGEFRVDYPDCGGKTLISENIGFDGDGAFINEEIRNVYLLKAVKAIDEEFLDQNPSLWRKLKKKLITFLGGSVSPTF
jgi:hypothetical protein